MIRCSLLNCHKDQKIVHLRIRMKCLLLIYAGWSIGAAATQMVAWPQQYYPCKAGVPCIGVIPPAPPPGAAGVGRTADGWLAGCRCKEWAGSFP
jgi:hypothetical protein